MFQDMILNKSDSIISRVNKIRDNIAEEMKTSKTELTHKIEETDKYFGEQLEIMQSNIDKNKAMAKELAQRTKEDLQINIKSESTDIKNYINSTKEEINTHKDVLQTKFDEKLRKIKDICSQYFSKYDKEQQTSFDKMKEIDNKCEEWAKLLVQPQELN